MQQREMVGNPWWNNFGNVEVAVASGQKIAASHFRAKPIICIKCFGASKGTTSYTMYFDSRWLLLSDIKETYILHFDICKFDA